MAFAYKGTFTVQSGQMPSEQSNFPTLILWTDDVLKTTGNGGQVTDANGFDIRPYSDTDLTSALTFELVNYDGDAGTVEMWVNHTVDVGTSIYLGIGDSALTSDGSSTSTWDSSYIQVLHFGDGTTIDVTDSSQAGNNATNGGSTATTGKVSGGADFVQADVDFINTGLAPNPDFDDFTIELWGRADTDVGSTGMFFSSTTGGSNRLYLRYNNPAEDVTAGMYSWSNTTMSLSIDEIAYMVLRLNGTTGSLWKNGSSVASMTSITIDEPTDLIHLGSAPNETGILLDGMIDEWRLSDVARSDDWLETCYNNQNSQSTWWGTPTFEALAAAGIEVGIDFLYSPVRLPGGIVSS